jgi:hypothetical protein
MAPASLPKIERKDVPLLSGIGGFLLYMAGENVPALKILAGFMLGLGLGAYITAKS